MIRVLVRIAKFFPVDVARERVLLQCHVDSVVAMLRQTGRERALMATFVNGVFGRAARPIPLRDTPGAQRAPPAGGIMRT